jgi:CBS domain-containing protein
MLISDVLREKGRTVVTVRPTDSVAYAVRKFAEHHIGAVVVEDRWMKPVGLFSERDFVSAIAHDGAAVLRGDVRQLMSSPIVSCRSDDRTDAVLATMMLARLRHMPVIDGSVLRGIVSLGDLVMHRLDEKALEADVLLDMTRVHA